MALTRRTYRGASPLDITAGEGIFENRDRKGVDVGLILFLICGAMAVAFAITMEYQASTKRQQIDDIKQNLEDGVILTLEMDREKDSVVSMGPHKARVAIAKKICPKPRLWMRLVGAALVSIPMEPENDDTSRWSASFAFPVQGDYHLEVRWYGCSEEEWTFNGLIDKISFRVKGGNSDGHLLTTHSSSPEIFPVGFWASKRKFKNSESIHSPYVWFSEAQKGTLPSATPQLFAETKLGISTVAIEGNPISKSGFHDLADYELVCFVGSTSSQLIRENFLFLKEQIDPEQLPVKFPYYPLNAFSHVNKDWRDGKSDFHKCKVVLISVDELDADISQSDYKKQVEHFIQQVVKCLHETTFPIWMLTVNNPPMRNPSRMCHSPSRHSHRHPCNDAIFDLFDRNKRFPPQVKLLDNTDLSDPQFEDIRNDLHAAIAMRIFALVSAQVDEWRSLNQIGVEQGLLRNGTLEPNNNEDYVFEALVAKA